MDTWAGTFENLSNVGMTRIEDQEDQLFLNLYSSLIYFGITNITCSLLGIGGWLHGQLPVAIFSVAASAIVGWPFAAAIGYAITL